MADQYFASSEGIHLGAATALVTLVVAPTASTRRIAVNEIGISFNGVTATAVPVIVRLVRTTVAAATAGGATGQAATPIDSSSPASLCTAVIPSSATPGVYTTAPTVGVTLRTWYVPPTSGIVIQMPLGQEADSPATAAAGFGIQCTAPAVVDAITYMIWSE